MAYEAFYQITVKGREAEIDIFGLIGDFDMFGEESVAAADFIRDLRALGSGITRLNVNIHSEGGSVWDAMAIYRALRDHPAETVVHVAALAASAASFIMLAGDRIEVAPEAQVMIHNPLAIAIGDHRQMQHAAGVLSKAKDGILNIYARRSGQDREHLSDLMDQETWLLGEEIKEIGFADVVKADQPKHRVAAGPLKLVAHWKHPPEAVLKRKPPPIPEHLVDRVERMRRFAG